MKRFESRRHAGKELAHRLAKFAGQPDVLVRALPRGGVPVAYEVAVALKVPMDVLVVRKLGAPGHEELAIGAIASGGIRVLNEDLIHQLRIDQGTLGSVIEQERAELQRREQQYRSNRLPAEVRDCTVILIDDGLATGATMLAAVSALRTQQPARIVVGVPAAAPQAIDILRPKTDEIVSVISPDPFEGVGKWYEDFSQTSDEEVQWLLADAERQLPHDGTTTDLL